MFDAIDAYGRQRGVAVLVDVEVANQSVLDTSSDEVADHLRAFSVSSGNGVDEHVGCLGILDGETTRKRREALAELGGERAARAGQLVSGKRGDRGREALGR